MKFQVPGSRFQENFKIQVPSAFEVGRVLRGNLWLDESAHHALELECLLEFECSLELGTWNLEFGSRNLEFPKC